MPYGCQACGKLFGGLTGFDAHRVGAFTNEHPDYGRRCLTAEELQYRGYELRSNGVWRTVLSEDALKALRK